MRLHTTPAQAPHVFDVLREHYRAVMPASATRRMRINWVVDAPDTADARPETLGLAQALAERGHTVRVCMGTPANGSVEAPHWQAAAAPAEIIVDDDALPAADASVATSAATAYIVAQSHESHFRFLLAADAGAPDADASAALPLRRIRLGATTGQSADTATDAEQVEQILNEYCW
jgi:hypothetical protein